MMFDVLVVLEKSDLLSYVEAAGGEPRGGGNRYSCACPLHGGDNPTAFSMSYKDGRWLWNCFTGSCGGGDAITFVSKWRNLDFQGSCEWIMGGKIEDVEGMRQSAAERLESARIETIAAQQREDARRRELQIAEKHLYYHKMRTQYHKDIWTAAGIDEGMQDFWTLGGTENFSYKIGETCYHTPTITIPIFSEENELLTIQHRLLNPVNPKDKYRPDVVGLHSHPFLAVPTMGFDGGIIWVMEGAKKAMVTWTKADSDWQCIGVMSQGEYKRLAEKLAPVGKKVIVLPDPNSETNPNAFRLAYELAHKIGGKTLRIPDKIDDMINLGGIDQDGLFAMSKQARKA